MDNNNWYVARKYTSLYELFLMAQDIILDNLDLNNDTISELKAYQKAGQFLLEQGYDFDIWHDSIIDYWNYRKFEAEQKGNINGEFNFYYFAQKDINSLKDLFKYVIII